MPKTSGEERPPLSTINRRSPVPYYVQLKEALLSGIESGHWGPNDRLPSESELCQMFSVSRTVVRQALQEMTHEGLIVREKGRGTFVAEPKISSSSLVHSLVGFFEDMESRGQPPVTQILDQSIEPAGSTLASRLELEPMTPVIKLERLRFVGEEPIVLVSSYLPYELCPRLVEADLTHRSLYAFLKDEYNLSITGGRRSIDAVLADDREAELLQVEVGSPLLRLDSVSYLPDGRPLEFFHGVFRGDRSRFEVEIGPARGAAQHRSAAGEDWLS